MCNLLFQFCHLIGFHCGLVGSGFSKRTVRIPCNRKTINDLSISPPIPEVITLAISLACLEHDKFGSIKTPKDLVYSK